MRQIYGAKPFFFFFCEKPYVRGKRELDNPYISPFVDFRKTPYTLAFSMGDEKVPFYSLVGMKMLRK